MGYELRQIQAETFVQDFETSDEKPLQCSAYILVATEAARQPHLAPTTTCWRSVLRPAYRHVLSQSYISQFFVIRPYAETKAKRYASIFMRLLYGPVSTLL